MWRVSTVFSSYAAILKRYSLCATCGSYRNSEDVPKLRLTVYTSSFLEHLFPREWFLLLPPLITVNKTTVYCMWKIQVWVWCFESPQLRCPKGADNLCCGTWQMSEMPTGPPTLATICHHKSSFVCFLLWNLISNTVEHTLHLTCSRWPWAAPGRRARSEPEENKLGLVLYVLVYGGVLPCSLYQRCNTVEWTHPAPTCCANWKEVASELHYLLQ